MQVWYIQRVDLCKLPSYAEKLMAIKHYIAAENLVPIIQLSVQAVVHCWHRQHSDASNSSILIDLNLSRCLAQAYLGQPEA